MDGHYGVVAGWANPNGEARNEGFEEPEEIPPRKAGTPVKILVREGRVNDSYFYHLLRMTIASAICTAMIGFGLFARRGDQSRRWLFVAGGILCSAMTAVTMVVNEHGYRGYRNEYGPIVELIIAGALLLPAVSLLIFGWKGRWIGDHPHCRKCGFDLFGKPAESTRCGECGTDLTSHQSIVLGLWSVRRWPVLIGLFMLILCMMLGAEAGREYTTGFDWYRLRPTWWLLRDLDSPMKRQRAVDALGDEMMSADLSPGHAQLIAERVLKDTEAGRPDALFVRLLLLIDKRNLLDEATTRRVMRQAAQLGFLYMPPVIERGRQFVIYDWLVAQSNANAAWGLQNLSWQVFRYSYRIGTFTVPASEITTVPVGSRASVVRDASSISLGRDWSSIPPGNVTVSRDVVLTVNLQYRGKLLVETSKATSQWPSRVIESRKKAR